MSKLNKTYGNLENVGYALGKICEAFCAKKHGAGPSVTSEAK